MNLLNPYDVLLIDDDPEIINTFTGYYDQQKDVEFHVSRNALETFQILISQSIDLIFMGEMFHAISGVEFVKILKEMLPEVPIVLVVQNHLATAAVFPGVESILEKPLSRDKVLDTMRIIIGNRVRERKDSDLLERLSLSEYKLKEKMLIMRTTLGILEHDTKNLFMKIFSALHDIPESDEANTLNEYIQELYEGISEALGYISAKKRVVSLIDMIASVRIGVEQLPLPSHARINLKYGPRKLFFIETTRLFKNIIINLVNNALKYSPADTKITISLTREKDMIHLEVIDSGMGIPDDDKKHVFNRNYRTALSEGMEGSGQGLWIAQNIALEEGGVITVKDNRESGGTIMSVHLPACSIPSMEHGIFKLSQWYGLPSDVLEKKSRIIRTIIELEYPNYDFDIDSVVFANLLDHLRSERKLKEREKYLAKLRSFLSRNEKGKSILLVDDSLFIHYSIAPMLIESGYRIVEYAFNGEEAATLYQILRPELVIMDVTMPMKSGVEAAKEIFTKNKEAKILFLSALGENVPLLENISTLFSEFTYQVISKPVKQDILIAAVKTLMEKPVHGKGPAD
ncbi:MAG: response regulator [Spirochaetaceae bacterium]|nr:MAG: response regulator [Spirochaetaceae bacterium]